MSSRRVVAIALVALLHAVIGYAFITGLAYNVVKKAVADLKTFDVEEAPPPPEQKPPPPPPEQKVEPPPVVAPPPVVQVAPTVAPPIVSVPNPPPSPPPPTISAPPAPPPPPAPKLASNAQPRGNPGGWVTTDDYPSRALREEKEGVTVISFSITTDGRAADCKVTQSSGTPELDDATCTNFVRRARYKPALDDSGKPIATTGSQRVRWTIPKE